MGTGQNQSQQRLDKGAEVGSPSRTLIYFPIMHTQADMGVLKDAVNRVTLEKLGRAGFSRKLASIEQLWNEIEGSIEALDLCFDRVRLYQDGLAICGREAEIVAELARKGSRNHQLLAQLMARGATLMGTESGDLLRQEYRLAQQNLTAPQPRSAGVAARRRALGEALLEQRDRFMARQINDTLKAGEIGILFLGMLHSLERYLPPDVKVIYPLKRWH